MARWWSFRPWCSDRDAATVGRAAERGACRFLRRRGLRLIERNFRTRVGEIDLVMRDAATIVFVEVRSRRHAAWGSAAESVGARKRKRIARAAAAFLASRPALAGRPARFDVVLVERPHYRVRYEWIRNAFTT